MTSLMAEQRLSNGCQVEFIGITDLIDRDIAAPVWHEARTLILEMQNAPHSVLNRKRTSSECVGASHIFITGVTSEHQLANFKTSANFHQGVRRIKEACQHVTPNDYITLIIDETIAYEAEEDPCVQFIKALENEILSGSLNIMMCKSFQKFSSLGTSKVKLGNLTIINNDCQKFAPVKAYFDANLETSARESSDELQMVTHHLKYNVSNEILLVQAIRKQVKFIKTRFFLDRKYIISSDLFLHDVNYVENIGLPWVDNYGFLFSSTVIIGRWSIGLEPQEMLCNIFGSSARTDSEDGCWKGIDANFCLDASFDQDLEALRNLDVISPSNSHSGLNSPVSHELSEGDAIANGEATGSDSSFTTPIDSNLSHKYRGNENFLAPINAMPTPLNIHSPNSHEKTQSAALISTPVRSTFLKFCENFGITEMRFPPSRDPVEALTKSGIAN
jgi:hypothetical protein